MPPMVGNAARAAALVVVAMILMSGCAAFASAPQDSVRPTRKPRPTLSTSPSATLTATPTLDPASLGGPPFPSFQEGVMVVDQAGIFSAATEGLAAQRIADIGSRHDAVVVVYAQYKPGADA